MEIYKIEEMDKSKPDYHIELFWYGLKESMNNFYRYLKITRPIDEWSKQLNKFQFEKKYSKIEEKIRNYMCLYAIDLMRFDLIGADSKILQTNIKRWNKVSIFHLDITSTDKYHNIVFLLFDIYCSLVKKISYYNEKIKRIFSEVELLIIYQDFTSLIEFSVETKLYSIIDKLYQYEDISEKIKELYNLEKIPKMKTKKLVNYLESKTFV